MAVGVARPCIVLAGRAPLACGLPSRILVATRLAADAR